MMEQGPATAAFDILLLWCQVKKNGVKHRATGDILRYKKEILRLSKCKINCFTRIDSMTFLRRYINPKKLHFWGEEKLVNYKNVIIKIQNVGNPT